MIMKNGLWLPDQMTKAFAIHPSKQDISMYFDSLKNPNKEEGVSIRTELAQKYYGLSLQHPELKVDIFKYRSYAGKH